MAARDLLDPRLVLFVVGCGGCEMDPLGPFDPDDEISECELEPVNEGGANPAPSRMMVPIADVRLACEEDDVSHTSVAVGPEGMVLLGASRLDRTSDIASSGSITLA